MKLNFHRKRLYLYVNFLESDRYKVAPFFEDYDETFVNYNFDSMGKACEYTLVGWKKKSSLKKNFKEDFFDEFFNK